MEDQSFLEDMEKTQREMCNITGNFMSLIFDRKNFIELIEWLHESYLNNNEVIDNLTIRNEQLLEKLEDTCFSSDVSYFHKVDCLEDSHDMMDHENVENCKYLKCLKMSLMRANHLFVKVSAATRPILGEDGALVNKLGQSKTLEGTLGTPVVSWGSWSETKQVDAMAKSLACG